MGRSKVEFQQFHDAYGKAYGAKIDRIAAERAWKRLSDKDKRAAIAGITAYRDYCQDKGVAMAYPGKYLNLHRWEIDAVQQSPTPDANATGTGTKPALADMETW